MEISIKWNVCRVCLQEETQTQEGSNSSCTSSGESGASINPMRHIFKDTKLAKQIYDCSGVLMEPNDSLPEKICKKCLTVLRHAVYFRTTCRNSEEYLQSVMLKARSATSLFKLDKRREESLELVDEVIDEIFQDDEKDVFVEINSAQEDIGIEKRKREPTKPTSEKSPGTKKSKVDANIIKTANHTYISSISCSKILPEIETTETKLLNILKNSEDVLEHETAAIASDSSDHSVEETGPTALLSTSPLCVLRSELSTMPDIKDEYCSKPSSVCSVADTYVLDEEQEPAVLERGEVDEGVEDNECLEEVENDVEEEVEDDGEEEIHHDRTCNGTETQLVQLQQNIHDAKPLTLDQILDVSDEEDFHPEVDIDSKPEEFFYIIEHDIKRERSHFDDEIDTLDQIDLISIEDETKSELNAPAMENVEYLVDGTDEQSHSELEPKRSLMNVTPIEIRKKQSLQKRKAGTELNVFVCDVCGNCFTNKHLLNFHMKIHRNDKSFECELCFKRFNAACNLTAHMRIHTGEKPFECQFCGRRFSDRSSHLKHERIHTNEKPYKCNTCGKAFSLSTSLKAHEKIHTGEKPYKCEPCLKSFKLPHQLKAHLNTHLHKLLSVEQ